MTPITRPPDKTHIILPVNLLQKHIHQLFNIRSRRQLPHQAFITLPRPKIRRPISTRRPQRRQARQRAPAAPRRIAAAIVAVLDPLQEPQCRRTSRRVPEVRRVDGGRGCDQPATPSPTPIPAPTTPATSIRKRAASAVRATTTTSYEHTHVDVVFARTRPPRLRECRGQPHLIIAAEVLVRFLLRDGRSAGLEAARVLLVADDAVGAGQVAIAFLLAAVAFCAGDDDAPALAGRALLFCRGDLIWWWCWWR